jgi:hypothetical protein
MANDEPMERRNEERFLAQGGLITVARSLYAIPAKILNISLGGLGLQYIGDTHWGKEADQLDILMIGDSLHLSKLPFQVVYDREESYNSPVDRKSTRLCGLKFGRLSEEHQQQLNELLSHHTNGRLK